MEFVSLDKVVVGLFNKLFKEFCSIKKQVGRMHNCKVHYAY